MDQRGKDGLGRASTPHRVKFEKKTNGIRGPPHNVRAPLLQVLITTNKNKNYYLFIYFISKKLEKKKKKEKEKNWGWGLVGGCFCVVQNKLGGGRVGWKSFGVGNS